MTLSRACVAALCLGLLAPGCKRGREGSAAAATSAAPAAVNPAQPVVQQCYQGCLDINQGKPVDRAELEKNCAHKCVRICSKACAMPRKDIPYKQALSECALTCQGQLDPALRSGGERPLPRTPAVPPRQLRPNLRTPTPG